MRGLVLLLSLLFCNVCFGATTFQQTLTTTVPASVNVTAINTASANGTIDATTGNSSSPMASFRLQTNGADSNYTYVVQAKLLTTGELKPMLTLKSGVMLILCSGIIRLQIIQLQLQ